VAKILEIYVIAKRSAEHTEMWKVKHTSQRGGSMDTLNEQDPGKAPSLVCSDCNAPWGTFSKCLLCKGTTPIDLTSTPLSVIEVEGKTWQLRVTEAGPTWVLQDAKVTKDAGYIEVGDLGRPPPAAASCADPGLVSFSEQVPVSQRLTLGQHVETFGKDEIFHPKGERPPTLEEQDETQSALIFHPKAIQVVQLKANLLATEATDLDEAAQEKKRQKLAEQRAQEDVDMDKELQVMHALQQGAHSVQSAPGAKLLRRVDLATVPLLFEKETRRERCDGLVLSPSLCTGVREPGHGGKQSP
jgi:hypothetical protein